MKKKNFVTILMVVFVIALSSSLFAQLDNTGQQEIQNSDNTTMEGIGGHTLTGQDVNGVYVPD